jgi:hypothetical protein
MRLYQTDYSRRGFPTARCCRSCASRERRSCSFGGRTGRCCSSDFEFRRKICEAMPLAFTILKSVCFPGGTACCGSVGELFRKILDTLCNHCGLPACELRPLPYDRLKFLPLSLSIVNQFDEVQLFSFDVPVERIPRRIQPRTSRGTGLFEPISEPAQATVLRPPGFFRGTVAPESKRRRLECGDDATKCGERGSPRS